MVLREVMREGRVRRVCVRGGGGLLLEVRASMVEMHVCR
jgi:hypothetical protein